MNASFENIENLLDEIDESFLDRVGEMGIFQRLLAHRRRRILLIHGHEGRGKTHLLHELLHVCRESQAAPPDERIVCTVLDFATDQMLDEPKGVIDRLRGDLAGSFDQQMREAEGRIIRDLAPSADAVPASPGAPSSVQISGGGTVNVSGSIVGRDQYMIRDSNVVIQSGAGSQYAHKEAITQRNNAFHAALKGFQAAQRVVLFFDHYEHATEAVDEWFHSHVLHLHRTADGDFSNLWLIVTGRQVPLQDQVDEWRTLREVELGPLPEEDVVLFCVSSLGLDEAFVTRLINESSGNTKLLFLRLRGHVRQSGTEGADG